MIVGPLFTKITDLQRIHTFKNAYIIMFISFVCGCALHVPLGFAYVVGEDCGGGGNQGRYSALSRERPKLFYRATNFI